jgi:hypothetical protein
MACETDKAPAVADAMLPMADKRETLETESGTDEATKNSDLLESTARPNT